MSITTKSSPSVERTDGHVIALALAAGRHLLWQPDAVRPAGAAHHRTRRGALPDRGAREFYQLSDRARHRRGGADLAGHPLPDLVCSGLGTLDVANICFLTGLTFWLGNLTAFGLSVLYEPGAISPIDYLPPGLNRWLAAALLLGVIAFVVWNWLSPRNIGTLRWPVRLPTGPMVLVQIVIGIFDLGAAALAMYVLIPPEAHVGLFPVAAVFIVATLLGFASHAPAGLGVFDATILIGLGGDDKEPLIAALLMFRLLYHLLPFVLALALFGVVEGWRGLRARRLVIG